MRIPCPICGKPLEYSSKNPWRPFCSERCKLIDLGAWAEGDYVIEGAPGSAENLSPEDYETAAERADEMRLQKKPRPRRAPSRGRKT